MTAEPIRLELTIGDQKYTWTGVADIDDAFFAMKLGRAISETVLEHAEGTPPSTRALREMPHTHEWVARMPRGAAAYWVCTTCGKRRDG
jgi:hypothetical protein